MTRTNKCEATITVDDDDRRLVCVLPAGHDGPVHETKGGEAWGDITLPAPHHRDPDAAASSPRQ